MVWMTTLQRSFHTSNKDEDVKFSQRATILKKHFYAVKTKKCMIKTWTFVPAFHFNVICAQPDHFGTKVKGTLCSLRKLNFKKYESERDFVFYSNILDVFS